MQRSVERLERVVDVLRSCRRALPSSSARTRRSRLGAATDSRTCRVTGSTQPDGAGAVGRRTPRRASSEHVQRLGDRRTARGSARAPVSRGSGECSIRLRSVTSRKFPTMPRDRGLVRAGSCTSPRSSATRRRRDARSFEAIGRVRALDQGVDDAARDCSIAGMRPGRDGAAADDVRRLEPEDRLDRGLTYVITARRGR